MEPYWLVLGKSPNWIFKELESLAQAAKIKQMHPPIQIAGLVLTPSLFLDCQLMSCTVNIYRLGYLLVL